MSRIGEALAPRAAWKDDGDADLAHRADDVRRGLLDTISRLDERRHQALDVRRQLREHVGGAATAAALTLLAAGAGVALIVNRITTLRMRRRRERIYMMERLWAHPERVGKRHEPSPSILSSLARTVIVTLVSRAIRKRL
jgi:hypothetical protein